MAQREPLTIERWRKAGSNGEEVGARPEVAGMGASHSGVNERGK